MPPVKASPDELQNLIAYLSRLSGIRSGPPSVPRSCTGRRNRLFQNPESEAGRLDRPTTVT